MQLTLLIASLANTLLSHIGIDLMQGLVTLELELRLGELVQDRQIVPDLIHWKVEKAI